MKHVSSIDKLPEGLYYAALWTETTHVPGDQRSKDYPGHGYPAHDVNSIGMVVFEDINDMKDWVLKEEARSYKKPYKIVKVEGVPITLSVDVTIGA